MRSLLLPFLSSAFLRGLQTTTLLTRRTSRSCSQVEYVPSSNVTYRVPRNPSRNSRIALARVCDHRLHHQFAALVSHCNRDTCLVYIQPNIFSLSHEGVPFLCSWCLSTPRLLRKGRPL